MALLTMALLTMALLTMAPLTMALLTMALLTMAGWSHHNQLARHGGIYLATRVFQHFR